MQDYPNICFSTYNNPQGFPLVTYQMAAAVLFTLPLVLMFFFAQKYILEGMVTSGLTGQ